MTFAFEYGNFELCHDQQDQNIYPFQSVQEDPHRKQPRDIKSLIMRKIFHKAWRKLFDDGNRLIVTK